jgi:hypothetical protein
MPATISNIAVAVPAAVPVPRDGLSKILLMGTSIFGGGAGLYLAYQLVRAEPARVYTLLQSWGPGYVLALFIAWALDRLLRKAVDMMAQSGMANATAVGQVAIEMRSIAEASHAQALALQTAADKDDRERDRLATLVEYSASQSRQALEQIGSLTTAVNKLATHIETLGSKGS